MKATKSCAVIIREISGEQSVLAFRHPLAGCQLVKGSINVGETPAAAAIRELREESGVVATVAANLGEWQSDYENQIWSFHLCNPATTLPHTWTHCAKVTAATNSNSFGNL